MGNSPPCCRNVKGDEDSGWLFNVLDFCDRRTRSNCLIITKRYYNTLTSDASFRWRLQRLHIEKGLYFPNELPSDQTWRSLFLDLDKNRHLWDAHCDDGTSVAEDGEGNKYTISVYARFKPLTTDCSRLENGRNIILPLHQRLALIRIDKGLDSNKDALGVLKDQGGWFKERWHEIEKGPEPDDDESSQPPDQSELTSGIKMIDSRNARVVVVDSTKGLREFQFDGVIENDTSQVDVYNLSARGLVCDMINGVSATCVVYGQTGSGKTFTMFGAPENQGSSSSFSGIVPRACSELMSAVRYRKESLNLDIECTVSVSFVEIYGNDILDLLKRGKRCGQNKVSAQRCVLDGNAEVTVECIDDVMKLLSEGEAQRRKASTAMNSRSSRAHSVFIVNLNQKCIDTGKNINSKLFLADLGGCEQTKKSKLDAGKSKHIEALKESSINSEPNELADDTKNGAGFVKSDRMREAVYINLGLMSLKSCVEALSQGSHVPYANSKLTMLLASGLGGNSKTSVIVCASQEEQHSSETINAFKFGKSCRRVCNTVRTQADMLGDLMKKLDLEIASCEEQIRKNEKWVVQKEKRNDSLAEKGTLEAQGFGGVEVISTSVLVGAEEDRKLLHNLLLKKAQLSGSDIDEIPRPGANSVVNLGFGKAHEYGLGNKFSLSDEKENFRFNDAPKEDRIPTAVKLGNEQSKNTAYMGISA